MNRRFTCYASVVSEIHQSDIYLTVKARLLETPRANLNGVRVTAAFVDEIVDNQSKYVGLPLCADVKNLANGDYTHLGHLYDARTGEFHSAQIGSFYQFEKEETADGAALIGYARIMKRNKAVCHAISELFADGALKFSFEISCGSYEELEDGTIQIDACEENFLEGAAVVSFPACENAVALDLVAECNSIADDTRKGDKEMNQENVEVIASKDMAAESETVEVAEEQTEVQTAETTDEVVSASEESHDEEIVAESTETEETNDADQHTKVAEAENAEVVVVEHHVSVDDVSAYDTDDGSSVEEHVMRETTVRTPIQTKTQEQTVLVPVEEPYATVEPQPQTSVCVVEVAESDDDDKDNDCDDHDDQDEKEKVAEVSVPDYAAMIAELKETIETLRKEIAEIKETPAHMVAQVVTSSVAQTVNPFVGDVQVEKKYSLLEKDEGSRSYSLLERA